MVGLATGITVQIVTPMGYYAGKEVARQQSVKNVRRSLEGRVSEKKMKGGKDLASTLQRWNEEVFSERGLVVRLKVPEDAMKREEDEIWEKRGLKERLPWTKKSRERKRFRIIITSNGVNQERELEKEMERTQDELDEDEDDDEEAVKAEDVDEFEDQEEHEFIGDVEDAAVELSGDIPLEADLTDSRNVASRPPVELDATTTEVSPVELDGTPIPSDMSKMDKDLMPVPLQPRKAGLGMIAQQVLADDSPSVSDKSQGDNRPTANSFQSEATTTGDSMGSATEELTLSEARKWWQNADYLPGQGEFSCEFPDMI